MKEVIWIIGGSAVGKETFINYLVGNPDANLLKQLELDNKKIVACQESVEFIGLYSGDPTVDHRQAILVTVPELLKDAEVVLIKWQGVDSLTYHIPDRLIELLSGVRHRIIALDVSDEELRKRLPRKKWWNPKDSIEEWISGEKRIVQEEVFRLNVEYGFDVVWVDTNQKDYKVIDDLEMG